MNQPISKQPEPDWLDLVRQKVAALRFGVVQLVVHDGRVVQIESTEKVRLERPTPSPSHPAQGA